MRLQLGGTGGYFCLVLLLPGILNTCVVYLEQGALGKAQVRVEDLCAVFKCSQWNCGKAAVKPVSGRTLYSCMAKLNCKASLKVILVANCKVFTFFQHKKSAPRAVKNLFR